MKIKAIILSLFAFLFISISSIFSQDDPFSFKWDNGFKLQNKDKTINLKFGGRIMVDHAFFSQDKDMDAKYKELITTSGTEFRRARFYSAGTVYDNVNYKLQLDFTGGKVSMKDAYIQLKNIPIINNIVIGHFKEPFRFDALTSSKYITFMERALPIDFSQERNNGIMIKNDILNNKISYQAGIFRSADKYGNDKKANDGFAFTARFSGLLLNNKHKKQLIHLGVGYSYRKPSTEEYSISSKPEAHLSSIKYLSETINDVEKIKLIDFEAVLVHKSLSIQSELLVSTIKNINITYKFSSYYSQISYFLTGESKKYKNSYSAFGRIKPKNNFGKNGIGAWEIAMRYSRTNLNDNSLFGGEQTDFTIALNWYLNPVTKIMFNTVLVDIKDVGKAKVFQTRFQIDF